MSTAAAETVDRRRAPEPGQPRPFRFPPFQRHRLANGLELLLAPDPTVPLTQLELYFDAGAQHDVEETQGLANLTAELLQEGSERRGGPEIAAQVEYLGAGLATGAGWNAAYASVSHLSRHLEVGLDLLAEVMLTPSFPEEELLRARDRRLGRLLQLRNEPAALAARYFARAVYRGTVYGGRILGTEETIQRLERPAIEAFYRLLYRPSAASLVAVGAFDAEDLVAEVQERFGSWSPEASASNDGPSPVAIDPPIRDGVEIHIVDRPGAAQTELRLGHAALARDHPDFSGAMVLNAILGGKFTSRINLNLRERHGYTYGAHSRFVGRRGPGPFLVSTAVATEVAGAASREIFHELHRIRREAPTADEIQDTRRYLLGTFVTHLQTLDSVAERLTQLALYRLGDDYFEHHLAAIAATGAEDVLRLAREHLDLDHLVVVAVGPAQELAPQLEDLGEVRIHHPGKASERGGDPPPA